MIFAGDEKTVFRDDQPYPFSAEPYFKAWLPLGDAPGSFLRLVPGQRPMLVYKQLEDYWYEPPSDPSGYWTPHFDIRIVRTEPRLAKLRGAGRAGSRRRERRRGAVGAAASRTRDERSAFPAHLDFTRDEDPLRDRCACAGAASPCAAT